MRWERFGSPNTGLPIYNWTSECKRAFVPPVGASSVSSVPSTIKVVTAMWYEPSLKNFAPPARWGLPLNLTHRNSGDNGSSQNYAGKLCTAGRRTV